MADNKAFAKAVASRKTPDNYRDIFALQKSIKHLSLLSAAAERFGKTQFHPDSYRDKPLLNAKVKYNKT
ncbi:MAG: hypothetical protein JNM51_14875 [Bacteroidia bacterium]|nr:hypothetical protein [Bacteroidia bacterium]